MIDNFRALSLYIVQIADGVTDGGVGLSSDTSFPRTTMYCRQCQTENIVCYSIFICGKTKHIFVALMCVD